MGDLTRLLRGKRVAHAMTNGSALAIQLEDGSEILVAWVNEDTGEPIKGRPVVQSRGYRMRASGLRELIALPRTGR
jgi:hypothetical protein